MLAEKNEDKVYVNQDESLTDLQTLIKYSFRLNFLHESLMIFDKRFKTFFSHRPFLMETFKYY